MEITSAQKLIEHLGADNVAQALGKPTTTVKRQARTGVLPASWFDALERLAGHDLPRGLFTFVESRPAPGRGRSRQNTGRIPPC